MVLFACHTFAIEAHNTKKFITEELGLPYIRIDTDFQHLTVLKFKQG